MLPAPSWAWTLKSPCLSRNDATLEWRAHQKMGVTSWQRGSIVSEEQGEPCRAEGLDDQPPNGLPSTRAFLFRSAGAKDPRGRGPQFSRNPSGAGLASALRERTAWRGKEVACRKAVSTQQVTCQQGDVCPCTEAQRKRHLCMDGRWHMRVKA